MPVSIARFVEELEKLKREMDANRLKHGEYDQRLARIIAELREQKVDADRPALLKTIDELLGRGVITPSVKQHVIKRLGL